MHNIKRLEQLPGLTDIKSLRGTGLRSIPKMQRTSCLEMYSLILEQGRLKKEFESMEKRKASLIKKIDSINGRLESLQKEVQSETEIKTVENKSARSIKRMAISY
ncbi:MAG: hypothetical protein ABIH89_06400 [Elusimicrobiota bacterium]